MTRPKSHHYVPQFYLSRFANDEGSLHVLDKTTGKTFKAASNKIACVNLFYELPDLAKHGLDVSLMEQQFSSVEGAAAVVLDSALRGIRRGQRVEAFAAQPEREALALFLVLQLLRTVEARRVLVDFIRELVAGDQSAPPPPASEAEERDLHASLLWHDTHVRRLVERVRGMVWLVGLNESSTLFMTSDNPALEKFGNNSGWKVNSLVTSVFDESMHDPSDYIVFPLSPRMILYCYDREHSVQFAQFDNMVTPVEFTSDMVNHENSGQVGMSSRFVYSPDGDFTFAEQFIREQPWVRDLDRARFAERKNPYNTTP